MTRWRPLLAALLLTAGVLATCPDAAADGPLDRMRPSVGYAYPAGGRAGTIVEVVVGGQNLRGVVGVHVSGEGVRAEVVRWMRELSFQQQRELVRRVVAERRRREAARAEGDGRRRGRGSADAGRTAQQDRIDLPAHPLLDDLATLTETQLDDVLTRFVGAGRKKQPNAQISEAVELLVEIAPGTPPGWRELRVATRDGLTNPVRFRVGDVREVREHETYPARVHDLTALELPLLVNGQILAGDVDRFRFRAARGQRIVLSAEARTLVPFLADAVPGWFQAVLSVRGPSGRELAYSDDAGLQPDPRVVLDVTEDGDHEVEIRDAIHRGREDFVYRLSIRDDVARAWTPSGADGPPALPRAPGWTAQATAEREPNDAPEHAQGMLPPAVVAGRIARPGDIDVYTFDGRAGETVVLEIAARRRGSPLDAVVRLVDPDGEVIAWSDDHDDGSAGVHTHHADPYLRLRLPRDGAYSVQVADVCGHGGAVHDYLLRVGPPRPDFDLVVTPSAVGVPAGRTVPLTVHVVRRDGFDGPVDLALPGAPAGFVLAGGRVPAGRDSVRATLTAPRGPEAPPRALRLVGSATIAGEVVEREAVPADARMQAFIYRHLVPAMEWLVTVSRRGARAAPRSEIVATGPVALDPGAIARIEARVPGLDERTVLHLRLDAPPAGVALDGWEVAAGRVVLHVRTDEACPPIEDNLIVEAWADVRGRRVFAGHLPAIPVRIPAGGR